MQRYRYECKTGSKKEWSFKEEWLTGRQIKECKNLSGPIYSLCRLHRSPQIKHGLLAHLVSQWVMPARWSWTVLWVARTKKKKKLQEKKVRLTCSLLAMFVVGKSRPVYANVPTGGASFSICLRLILFQLLPNSKSKRQQAAAPVIRLHHGAEETTPPHVNTRPYLQARVANQAFGAAPLGNRSAHTIQQDTPSPDSDYPASHSTV